MELKTLVTSLSHESWCN